MLSRPNRKYLKHKRSPFPLKLTFCLREKEPDITNRPLNVQPIKQVRLDNPCITICNWRIDSNEVVGSHVFGF